MTQPLGNNFLNKYRNPNVGNSSSWSKYNVGGQNYYNDVALANHQFESNPDLAREVLNRAGPNTIYNRPGYQHEISNTTRVTTEVQNPVQYQINQDNDPIRVVRQNEPVNHVQDVRVRYLEPPRPPAHAPIVIKERQLTPPPPAPPIIIRQREPSPPTPPPLVIREKPPVKPFVHQQPTIVEKIIPPPTPPPRQVIVHRIPAPDKPRPIIYEKWLPYQDPGERPVVVEKAKLYEKPQPPKNLIYEYEKPPVNVQTHVFDEGVLRSVDPDTFLSSRADGEVRIVDKIHDLPVPNTYGHHQPHSYSPAPRPYNPPPVQQASNVPRANPWNTTYATSYTGRGFPTYRS